MKILLFILLFFTIGTSSSNAINHESLNLIIDSELINTNFPIIRNQNFILVPMEKFLDNLNIPYTINTHTNEKINIEFSNNTLELYLNSDKATINGQSVRLIVPTILQDNQAYVLINLFDDLTKLYIKYDTLSNSIFATSKSDFKKINFFFNKVENILKQFHTINIDVINEIKTSDGSSYSIGNNIYIDRTLNKIFQKNMLDNEWKESNIKLSSTINTDFNNSFFAGISVDILNSNNDYIIFKGYHPLDNNCICNSILYINPTTLKIEKQISNFNFENNKIKQTIFYSYN